MSKKHSLKRGKCFKGIILTILTWKRKIETRILLPSVMKFLIHSPTLTLFSPSRNFAQIPPCLNPTRFFFLSHYSAQCRTPFECCLKLFSHWSAQWHVSHSRWTCFPLNKCPKCFHILYRNNLQRTKCFNSFNFAL